MTFLNFAQERGLIIDHLVHDRWARVPTVDHPHKRNGAYFFSDSFGHVQNWATMDSVESWQSDNPRTPFEQQDLQRRINASKKEQLKQREENQKRAAQKASWILSQCNLDHHSYLERKGFKDAVGNVWHKPDPLLVIPMYHNSNLCGCQLISESGKKFLTGQRTNDAYFKIGNGKRNFIVEGYASGLSLQAILAALKIQSSIYITFSVGNATRIAKTLPDAFWVADHDESLVGQTAAAASGLKWWMPEQVGWDVNDLHLAKGLFYASQTLRKALT